MLRNIAVLSLLLAAPAAFAQDEEDSSSGGNVKYKERTEIDFEAVDVSGELVKPQGQLLVDRKRASFNPLIHIREDFNAEMKASVDEVK